jgi:hypothetical protein
MELLSTKIKRGKPAGLTGEKAFGEKIGLIGKLFGCWHKELSRPFTNEKSSYRVCLSCGAMKQFDTSNLKTYGPFYHPPAISLEIKR